MGLTNVSKFLHLVLKCAKNRSFDLKRIYFGTVNFVIFTYTYRENWLFITFRPF